MPKTNWFKNLWKWKKNKNKKKKSNLPRTKRMKSFKINKISCVKIRAYDLNGKDLTPYLKSSYNYNGVPGGFYLDTNQINRDRIY